MSRYTVCIGLGGDREFASFPEALSCYVEHIDDRLGVALLGESEEPGSEADGLTADERSAVELADEMAVRYLGVG